jgi:hypothetical protein
MPTLHWRFAAAPSRYPGRRPPPLRLPTKGPGQGPGTGPVRHKRSVFLPEPGREPRASGRRAGGPGRSGPGTDRKTLLPVDRGAMGPKWAAVRFPPATARRSLPVPSALGDKMLEGITAALLPSPATERGELSPSPMVRVLRPLTLRRERVMSGKLLPCGESDSTSLWLSGSALEGVPADPQGESRLAARGRPAPST